MDALKELQNWYQDQCNGDWEHTYGVQIGTLDNPGWDVRIDLTGTDLAGCTFAEVSDLKPETEWMRCWIEDGKFRGVGGSFKLEEILQVFLTWAKEKGA
jgi:hypothetical protein